MKEVKLEKIAEISSGLVLRRFSLNKRYLKMPQKQIPSTDGKQYHYTTLKSMDDNKIDLNLLETTKVEKRINDHYLLKKGDIIMKLSSPFSAAVIKFDCENLLCSSHFAIIRTIDEFDPEYLSFILNGKYVRKQLHKLTEGDRLPIIKINYLNKVKIRFRDRNEQIKYANILSLFLKRRELQNRKMTLEKMLVESILSDL